METREPVRISRGLIPGASALSGVLKRLGGPALRRQSRLESGLIAEWPNIVGEFVAERSAPLRLTWPRGRDNDAVLELGVESAIAPELQHLEPQILERINGYFGFAAVGRLKLTHGRPAGARPVPQSPAERDLSAEEKDALKAQVAPVAGEGLKRALEALGRHIWAQGEQTDKTGGDG